MLKKICLLSLQDKLIFHDQDFPEIYLDQFGSHGHHRFNVPDGHSRLYLPEAMVLKVKEYAKQKQENNTFEAQEAKKWGMSIDEYREQIEMMRKAEDGKEKEFDDRSRKYVHEDETGGLRDLERSAQPIMGIDEGIGQCFISRDEEQEREHKQVEYD